MRQEVHAHQNTIRTPPQDSPIARVERVFRSRTCPPPGSGKLARAVLVALLLLTHHAEANGFRGVGDDIARVFGRLWPHGEVSAIRAFSKAFDDVEPYLLTAFNSFDNTPVTQHDIQPLVKEIACLYAEIALDKGTYPTISEVATTVGRYRPTKVMPRLSDAYFVKSTIEQALNGTLVPSDLDRLHTRLWLFRKCIL